MAARRRSHTTLASAASGSSSRNSSPPQRAARSSSRRPVGQAGGDRAQDGVAGGVAVDVVDGLEAVDVDEHRAERRDRGGARAAIVCAQHVVGVAAVGQAGEHVGAGELLELGVAGAPARRAARAGAGRCGSRATSSTGSTGLRT